MGAPARLLRGQVLDDVKIAINVSPIQFRQKDFVATVNRILAESGMDTQRVELELTEGVVIADAVLPNVRCRFARPRDAYGAGRFRHRF